MSPMCFPLLVAASVINTLLPAPLGQSFHGLMTVTDDGSPHSNASIQGSGPLELRALARASSFVAI